MNYKEISFNNNIPQKFIIEYNHLTVENNSLFDVFIYQSNSKSLFAVVEANTKQTFYNVNNIYNKLNKNPYPLPANELYFSGTIGESVRVYNYGI